MKTWIRIAFALGLPSLAMNTVGDEPGPAIDPLKAPTSQQFVSDAAMGGKKEVCLSEVVLARTTNTDIQTFAKRMVKDHDEINQRLEKLAGAKGLSFPSTNTFLVNDPNWSHPLLTNPRDLKGAEVLTLPTLQYLSDYQTVKHLRSLAGDQLERTYLSDTVSDHLRAVSDFESASASLLDPELKRFASDTLPTLKRHEKMAEKLNDKYNAPGRTIAAGQPGPTALAAPAR